VITGTAGAGKTLSAMRIALALSADGTSGYVYNSDFAGGIRAIRDAANTVDAGVLVIDAPDRFGRAMTDLLTRTCRR
jgi:Mrp family chromosome partitioning ATPase